MNPPTQTDAEPPLPGRQRPVANQFRAAVPRGTGLPLRRGRDPVRGARDGSPGPDQRRQGSERVPRSVQWRAARGQIVPTVSDVPSRRRAREAGLDGLAAAHEYEMMRQAWKGGVRVPTPARRVENRFSMRYLGTDEGPAPRLKDVVLEDPREFLDRVLDMIRRLIGAGVVHGDLSAFNVLVHEGEPWVIDFSESSRVDRAGSSPWVRLTEARAALESGLAALQVDFRRYDLRIDIAAYANELVESLDRFGVLH